MEMMSPHNFVHPQVLPPAMARPLTPSRLPSWEQLAADARHAIASCLDLHFSSPIPRIDRVAVPSTTETQIPNSVRQFLSEQQTTSLPSTPTNSVHAGRRCRARTGSVDTAITYTPATHRISKAKKGKRVHACQFPGCPKIFTRAEHRRRHELNHNPKSTYICKIEECGKGFHRSDLLARHVEKHELDAMIKPSPTPQRKQSITSTTMTSDYDHIPLPPSVPSSTDLEQYEFSGPATTSLDPQLNLWAGEVPTPGDNIYSYPDDMLPYLSPDRSLSPSSEYFPAQPQATEQSGSVSGASATSSPVPFSMVFPDWNPLETLSAQPSNFPPTQFDSDDILQPMTYQQLQGSYADWSEMPGLPYDGTMHLPQDSLAGMPEWK